MLQGQCHDSATHSQKFAKGCESFESCVALSRQYALKIDIDAIETVGIAQLALGKGLNSRETCRPPGRLARDVTVAFTMYALSTTPHLFLGHPAPTLHPASYFTTPSVGPYYLSISNGGDKGVSAAGRPASSWL